VRNSHRSPKICTTIKFSFKCCLKVGKFEWSDIKCCGRLLQTVGAEWQKARSANTEITWLTCSRPWLSDRSWRVVDCDSLILKYIILNTAMIMPVCSIQDLGICVYSDVSMRSHVAQTVSSCFTVLQRIRSIHWSVTRLVLQSLVASLVSTWLEYGSATLAGLPRQLLDRLKSVTNAATRLIFFARKYDHVTPPFEIFTGYMCHKESNTIWRSWRSVVNIE